jgi:mannose-6-phosphate isomerase-like protein (cupin superfamily)
MARAGQTLINPVTGHRYDIVKAAADTGGALLEMVATFPAGAKPPPEHLHPRQEERFEVLQGAVRVKVAGQVRRLNAGTTLVVPAGTVHAMWNPEPIEARVRWETRPALRTEQFFESLVALARQGRVNAKGAPDSFSRALLLYAHRHEMRLARPSPFLQRVMFGGLALLARITGRRLP